MNLQSSSAFPAITIDFAPIRNLVAYEMSAVDSLILEKLDSKVELITQIGNYITNNGGKRLRPLLLLLLAKALGKFNQSHIVLATTIEFLHTASLLHDDVIDEATQRRGQKSANTVWGNAASILAGDFLYAKAFQMLGSVNEKKATDLFAQTCATLAEGEALQLLNCHNPDINEACYLKVISDKTAVLFRTAAHLAALASKANPNQTEAVINYADALGMAFQLVDDALDYSANTDELGKNPGADLAEGKTTLPLIYAMQHASAEQVQIIIDAIKNGNREAFPKVHAVVISTHALDYTLQCAHEQAQLAITSLACLPDSIYKDALIDLANFSVLRRH